MIIVQCKTYLDTDLVWINMRVCLSVEADMLSAFPYYRLTSKITQNFDSKFHDSYLMKCLPKMIQYGDNST